jgi:peptidoglycan hydrolase CwlO-like protein
MNNEDMISETNEEIYSIQEDIIELEAEIQLKQEKLYELNYKLGLLKEYTK